MAKSALPLLLLAGGAAIVVTKGKKKKKKRVTEDTGLELPEVTEEVEEEEEEPEPEPEPEPSKKPPARPIPKPEPAPAPEPEPAPSGRRPKGPSGAGSCVETIYARDPEYIDPAIADVLTTAANTAFPEEMYYFYIKRPVQVRLYNAVASRFLRQVHEQETRTVGPVILREELNKINSGCEWFGDIDLKDAPTKLVWEDAKHIATLAAITTGFEDPAKWSLFKTGKRFTVSRQALNMPDPGFADAPPGNQVALEQRVEFIATQDDTLENAEHLIGKVTKTTGPNGEKDLFEIRVVGTFGGEDVAPKLTAHHGFKFFKSNQQGSNAYFSKRGPTGIYRIFPKGAV